MLVDSSLSSALAGIEKELAASEKIMGPGREWFSLDSAGTLIFWGAKIYFGDPGSEPRESRHNTPRAIHIVCDEALAAEARGDYERALSLYRRVSRDRALTEWAGFSAARIESLRRPRSLLDWVKAAQSGDFDALTPDGAPVMLVAAGYLIRHNPPAEILPYLHSALANLRSGRWWLGYEQRRLYDAELRIANTAAGPDESLAAVAAIHEALKKAAPFRRDAPTRLLIPGKPIPLLVLVVPQQSDTESWRGAALTGDAVAMFFNTQLNSIRRAVPYALTLTGASRSIVWGDSALLAGGHEFQLRALSGLTIFVGEAASERSQIWLWYGLIAVLIAMLGFGIASTARVVRREMELARRQSEFTAGVTHDFKSPITGIRLLVERIGNGRGLNAANISKYCDAVKRETDHLDQLVNRLLETHRIQSGEKRYYPAPNCASEVAESAIAHFRTRAEAKSISLTLDVDDPTREVDLDRTAIQDALENLLDNAIKYSPPETKVNIKIRHAARELVLSVRDEGIGIDRSDLSRIFDRFYRGRRADQQSIEGTGLGLALVKAAAEAHGGTVEAESSASRGSEFRIRIPIHEETYAKSPHRG